MRLINIELGINIEIIENRVNVLVIEHPFTLRSVVEDILKQIEGEDGDFVLSDKNRVLPISKHIELVLNPFALDLNSKKIQNKLFQEIKLYAEEKLIVETNELNKKILEFLEMSLLNQSYSLGYDFELDFQNLLKLYHVGFKEDEKGFVELLIEFIRIQSNLLGAKAIVFLNLKSFLSENELNQLYEFAFYSKINLILLENLFRNKIHGESVVIIDSDRCVIEI
ncbi:CRISPR-associated protein Csn2 [Alkalibacter saccharofermentans DSM 14828]|uniref:CRISPR-associated protein Csn2 n=1 Tax=Alkalibacter saccharofermentans DSM 14828 TaxID=1120975 RepID=A0A1M4Z0V5_9FIRM|nr:CRISPR-associated protein Csn2 [Alkalibacter saccharofermentans DSM 14828]